ncbi:sigma-70, region 3 protein [Besnoitia besnoiti]|uniref:Sigma-70, region 3 protein n=1 Tax=Besnoitia besnoiti TaxID=94643 RepID=A0A2A9MDD6_BESBE|nr:sigma-70, region 3 protein [Besnoitia besnoiti]PFH36005.1 sigma-70, region 3 protein [Besnoitia besnoiti]
MEGEQSKNEKKRARKGRGDGPPSIETGIVSEYDETPDSAKRSRLAKELRSRAEGASASVRSSSSRLQQDLLADETDPSAQVAANETLGAGAREAARVTRADEADDEEEEEGDHWGDAPQSSWTLGKLMSKREYARLLSLLRVEAVHAALEGSENEEPIPLSLFAPAESASASSAQLRRPPTVQEWAAAATGGDVKLLGEKLRESRELLDVCLRRLHPLATVAVRRFRGANLFAAQQRKLYQEQGDYDAIRALMEKRNEEEMELLLVALQGIRQGLRRHARTAMRRRVRLRKAAHAATLHAEEDEADAEEGNDDEAERELDETEEDRLFAQTEDKGTKHTLRGKAAPDIAEPRRGADERKAKTQRAETSSVAPSPRKTGESDLISPSLPELPPPPSVAYWLWMRTAMVDWEQQKRQVTQFPWRWWKEAARGRKAAHGLYAELGREPTEAEVADRLGLSLEKWRDISVATRAATALETELGGPHGNQDPNDRQDTVGDLLASEDSLESETKIFEAELETQVLDLAAKALRPDEYRMIKALISDHQSSASPFSPGGGSPAASLSVSSSSSSADAAENEREASRAQTLHFMMGDCVDEKLRKAIQKMKEVEVKRILESLSPEERREGLASPGALEKVVQRKSTVLQLCLAASTKQGFE